MRSMYIHSKETKRASYIYLLKGNVISYFYNQVRLGLLHFVIFIAFVTSVDTHVARRYIMSSIPFRQVYSV